MIKYVLIIIASVLLVSGCATPQVDTTTYHKIKETDMKWSVPLYQGQPPVGYSYRDLGPVTTKFTMGMIDSENPTESLLQPLQQISVTAQNMGANAMIMVKTTKVGWGQYVCQGEAVVFDTMPPDQ